MTKSEIWGTMGDWGQITKFTNFCSRCPKMTQTWKATLLEAEKPHVAKPKWPIFGKIRKNNVLFSILAVFWPENGEKRPFLVVGWLRKVLFYRVEVYDLFQNWWRNVRILSGWLVAKPKTKFLYVCIFIIRTITCNMTTLFFGKRAKGNKLYLLFLWSTCDTVHKNRRFHMLPRALFDIFWPVCQFLV